MKVVWHVWLCCRGWTPHVCYQFCSYHIQSEELTQCPTGSFYVMFRNLQCAAGSHVRAETAYYKLHLWQSESRRHWCRWNIQIRTMWWSLLTNTQQSNRWTCCSKQRVKDVPWNQQLSEQSETWTSSCVHPLQAESSSKCSVTDWNMLSCWFHCPSAAQTGCTVPLRDIHPLLHVRVMPDGVWMQCMVGWNSVNAHGVVVSWKHNLLKVWFCGRSSTALCVVHHIGL